MSVTAAAGFVAAGIHGGVKDDAEALDLALVATDDGTPVSAAGVFTPNKMTAAPVQLCQAHLRTSGGHAAAVFLNSGNANAATGESGHADAEELTGIVGAELGCAPHHVLMCSTGLIGHRLPVEAMAAAVPDLVAARATGGAAGAPGGPPPAPPGRGHPHDRHGAQGDRGGGRRLRRGGHGQGRGDAVAEDGHDAGRVDHRCSGACRRSARRPRRWRGPGPPASGGRSCRPT